MPLLDDINRVLRDFERYTGDGQPGAPTGAPLPTGDPSSGVHNLRKHDLRELLKTIAQTMGDPDALETLIAEVDSTKADVAAAIDVPTVLQHGYFLEGAPQRRKGSRIAARPSAEMPVPRVGIDVAAYGDGILHPAAGLLNKHLVGGFIIAGNEAEIAPLRAYLQQVDAAGVLRSSSTYSVISSRKIADGLWYFQAAGQMMRADTQQIYLGVTLPAGIKAWASAFSLSVYDVAQSTDSHERRITAALATAARAAHMAPEYDITGPLLDYTGASDLSSVWVSAKGLAREMAVNAVPASRRPAVNFLSDWIDGVQVRAQTDDIAPLWLPGLQIGANHGWTASQATAAGHGKTVVDQGSVYSLGGAEYMLTDVINANTVVLTAMIGNASPPTGTYTHVRGGVSSTPLVVTSRINDQVYPSIQRRTVKVLADDVEVTPGALVQYRNRATIAERYEIAAKSDLLAWIGSNGGIDPIEPRVPPLYTLTTVYDFDRDAQCTISAQVYAHAESTLSRVSVLQAAKVGSPEYYVPKALPVTINGQSVDLARVEPSSVLAAAGAVDISPARAEPDGILADRALMLHPDYTLATGFAPVQSAEQAARRLNAVGNALVISSAGKIYMSGVEKPGTTPAGTVANFVAYRHILRPRSGGVTAAYVVRSRAGIWLYLDWHDYVGRYLAPVPADLLGRSFEVVEARNATVEATGLSDPLSVAISAAGDYAYLILRVI